MDLLDAATCSEHGWFAHVGVHEAGHATAATLLGFDFLDVSITPARNTLVQFAPGARIEAGGLRPSSDQPTEWVGPRPADALILLLAGSLAEQEILAHHIDDGFSRDFEIWRLGAGRADGDSSEEIADIIRAGTTGAKKFVADNRDAILRVYQLFVDKAPKRGGALLPFDDALVLSPDEVRAAVMEDA